MDRLLYIGAYAGIGQAGISTVRLDHTGELVLVSEYCEMENPSYLSFGQNGCLYAVSEKEHGGEVRGFHTDETGKIVPFCSHPVSGGYACHIAVNSCGNILVVSNYGSGTVDVLSLDPDGSIQKSIASLEHSGSGPNTERQKGPHAHFARFHPEKPDIFFTVDLGCDVIRCYRTEKDHIVSEGIIELPKGSGPRHLLFSPVSPDLIYVICELALCVYTVRLSGTKGEIIGKQPCMPESFIGSACSAAVKSNKTGTMIYASTRAYNGIPGEDCVAVYDVKKPQLTLKEPFFFREIANEPRDIAVIDGFLLVACQSGGKLMCFKTDNKTGIPVCCTGTVDIPGACCICPDMKED